MRKNQNIVRNEPKKEPKRGRNKEPKVGCKEIIDVIYVYVKENRSTFFTDFRFCIFKKEYQSAKIDKAKINSYGGI